MNKKVIEEGDWCFCLAGGPMDCVIKFSPDPIHSFVAFDSTLRLLDIGLAPDGLFLNGAEESKQAHVYKVDWTDDSLGVARYGYCGVYTIKRK